MSSCIDFYTQQAQKSFSESKWLLKLQEQALDYFITKGLPTRADEGWKYTSVQQFNTNKFAVDAGRDATEQHALEVIATGRQSDAPIGKKIPIINGEIVGLQNIQAQLPSGVIVESLDKAVIKHATLVQKYLNKILKYTNGMQALNSAMLKLGVFVYIPENVQLAEPILLTHFNTEDDSAVFLRHLIVAEDGAKACIIEDYQGGDACNYYTNVITEVNVASNADVKHYKVQREGDSASHFGHVFVKQYASSNFATHLLSIGGQWSRSDTSIDLLAENANCLLNGVYMPVADQQMDQQTEVRHNVAHCSSEQDYRGVAADKAQGVFNGKIYVAKDANATIAKQQNKNLLLSNQAQIYTKPQLEIFADDVVCTHGATVGQLDADALFYFATRGIAEDAAKRYLLQAFAADNLNKVDNETLAKWMSSILEKHMR